MNRLVMTDSERREVGHVRWLFTALLLWGIYFKGALAAWSLPPIDISEVGGGGITYAVDFGPKLAIDSEGNATAIWLRTDDAVQTARYSASSSTWSSVTTLSVGAGSGNGNPQVVVDDDGNATAIWVGLNGPNLSIETARYTASGNTWSAVTDISAPGENAQYPQVGVDENGDVTAVWYRFDGSDFIVQTARYTASSNTWGGVTALSAAGQSALDPQIAVEPGGDAMAVWIRSNGTHNIVQAAHYSVGTNTWGSVTDLSAAGQSSYFPQVVVDSDGNATASWIRRGGLADVVQTARYSADSGTWSAVTDLAELSPPGLTPNEVRLAVDTSGNVIAVWVGVNGPATTIQTARYSASGASWSAVTDLSDTGQNAYFPQVAVDSDGNAVVVWQRSDGSHFIVQTARYSAQSDAWSIVTDLSEAGASAQYPQVVIDAVGNDQVVWLRSGVVQTIRYTAVSASNLQAIPALSVWAALLLSAFLASSTALHIRRTRSVPSEM